METQSMIQQNQNIAHALCVEDVDFTKRGNTFLYVENGVAVEVVNRHTGTTFCIDIITKDQTISYCHHKVIGGEYFSFLTRNLKKL